MIRVLLFDIGNVLIQFDPRIALQELVRKTAFSLDQMTGLLKQWNVILEYECGRLQTEEFFREICSYLGLCDLTLKQFEEIWSGIFFDGMLVSPDTLRSLRQRYRLMLLSNTNAMHFDVIQRKFPVVGEFHDALLSFELGVMKPDPRIFHEAIVRSRCAAEEIFYIDDIDENLQAARLVGITGTRFESEAQLLSELKNLGIEV